MTFHAESARSESVGTANSTAGTPWRSIGRLAADLVRSLAPNPQPPTEKRHEPTQL